MSLTSIEGAIHDLQRHDWGAAAGTDLVAAAKHAQSSETAAAEARAAELQAELTLCRSQLSDATAAAEADAARLRTLLARETAARQSTEGRAQGFRGRQLTRGGRAQAGCA